MAVATDDPNLPSVPVPDRTLDRWIDAPELPPHKTITSPPAPPKRAKAWSPPRRDIQPYEWSPPADPLIYNTSAPPRDDAEDRARRDRLHRIAMSPTASSLGSPRSSPEDDYRLDRLYQMVRSPREEPAQGPSPEEMALRDRLERVAATPLVTPVNDFGQNAEQKPEGKKEDEFGKLRAYTDHISKRLDDLVRQSPWTKPLSPAGITPRLNPRAMPGATPRQSPRDPGINRKASPAIGPDADDAARLFGDAPGSGLAHSDRLRDLEKEIEAERNKLLNAKTLRWGANPSPRPSAAASPKLTTKALPPPPPPPPQEPKGDDIKTDDGKETSEKKDKGKGKSVTIEPLPEKSVVDKANEATNDNPPRSGKELIKRDEQAPTSDAGSASPLFGQ